MSLDQWIAASSPFLTLIGLLVLAWQLRDATSQRETDSLVKICDVNRERISLGFSNPALFAILKDSRDADPELERHYLQLWLNHIWLFHVFLGRAIYSFDYKEILEKEATAAMSLSNMQRHWEANGEFYPVEFQKFINRFMKKNAGSPNATQAKQVSGS